MRRAWKIVLGIVGTLVTIVLLVVIVGAVYLASPGQPSASRFLKFEGYIFLPRHGNLNVMDYLTLSRGTLFVTGTSSGSVFRILLSADGRPQRARVDDWPGEPRPHGVALVPGRDLAFVTRSEANEVDVFTPSQLKLKKRIAVAEDADAILYDRFHNLIYVANGDAQLVTLIDPEKESIVGTIKLGGKPEFAAIDPATHLLYQNIESQNSIAAVDLDRKAVTATWPTRPCEAPTGLAIDAALRRAFIVCGRNALLVVFDLDNHRVVGTVAIGGGPDSVAFDPGLRRIYATGVSGQVSVVQQKSADSYELLDMVSTHFGAHTLAVDPETHRVYVAYASLMVAPRIAVFSAVP
jgi:DNA-binding beta-propeller fold protein YncE